ncbi:MAG: alkyl hydroperoxide reductase [bacterium]
MTASSSTSSLQSKWMFWTLMIAAVYNGLWGLFIILFPEALFDWSGISPPLYPEIWQCVGMIVGVYSIGYAIAANRPLVHWPIVLVGLLGKVFGPIGFISAWLEGTFNPRFGLTILTNDLIWWIPFSLILLRAYQADYDQHAKSQV